MGTVDILSLLLSHALLGLAAWRIMRRDDLDADPAITPDGQGERPGDA